MKASAKYGIPKGTLYDNILGKSKRMQVMGYRRYVYVWKYGYYELNIKVLNNNEKKIIP